MRVSILERDIGYRADAGFFDIFLNGVLIRHAITADEEQRAMLVYILDDNGRPIKNPDQPREYLTEVKKGEVHIRKRVPH